MCVLNEEHKRQTQTLKGSEVSCCFNSVLSGSGICSFQNQLAEEMEKEAAVSRESEGQVRDLHRCGGRGGGGETDDGASLPGAQVGAPGGPPAWESLCVLTASGPDNLLAHTHCRNTGPVVNSHPSVVITARIALKSRLANAQLLPTIRPKVALRVLTHLMLEQAFQVVSATRLMFHTRVGGTERVSKWPKVTGPGLSWDGVLTLPDAGSPAAEPGMGTAMPLLRHKQEGSLC